MSLPAAAMVFLGLFLVGGVISGIRQGLRPLALLAGFGAILAISVGVMWWE